ncbi:MAG: acyl-CoA thioesterase [Burkholderiales bacterium]|nr:acyl-CoA thioesterase [Betaproteobacteria bacterium]
MPPHDYDAPTSPEELDSIGLPARRHAELRVVAMPADANPNGDIFGGWIMSHVDMAGGIAAMRRAHGRVATVAVNSFVIKQSVAVGDLVSFYAHVTRTGTTSVTVGVGVYSQPWADLRRVVKVADALLTYVAIDAEGNKRTVGPPPADGQ